MNSVLDRFDKIQADILENSKKTNIPIEIIAVSKTFPLEKIKPLIDRGHIHFGENKVQETEKKWKNIKNEKKSLKLHMLGRLQTNKAKKAVLIFDYIHSLDSKKLAVNLKKSENETGRKLCVFRHLMLILKIILNKPFS